MKKVNYTGIETSDGLIQRLIRSNRLISAQRSLSSKKLLRTFRASFNVLPMSRIIVDDVTQSSAPARIQQLSQLYDTDNKRSKSPFFGFNYQ